MKRILRIPAFFLFISFVPLACKKDTVKEPEPEKTGTMTIEFKNMVDAEPLVFGKDFISPKGDTFKVSKFNYYISNIVITKDDNSTYAEPESYRIIKQSTASSKIVTLSNIPIGSYKSIRFMLGVDSARNSSGAQTGGLDKVYATDMYWDWNQGYIFFKLEGSSPKSSTSNKNLEYHIGGFGGTNKAQRTMNINFSGATVNISSSASPRLYLTTNVNEVFKNPVTIDFAINPKQLSPGIGAKTIADNYADMISFDHIQN